MSFPLQWRDLYNEAELYKAAVRLYSKPLFAWRKALVTSADGANLYDFARNGLSNLDRLHRRLERRRFQFQPGVALHRNFNGKRRTLYIYPWVERLVDLLLYRMLTRALDGWFSRSSYAYRCTGYGVDRCQRDLLRHLRRRRGPVYVMKRDIRDFFGSIDHDLLREKLRSLIPPGDYLFSLLEQRIRFEYLDDAQARRAERGVPFGTATACLFANVYLTQLDRRLEAIPALRFFRYADDLLAVADTREAIEQAAEVYGGEMQTLGLESKLSHQHDLVLGCTTTGDAVFPPVTRFRHLGLEFRADGSVGLSRDKFRKICNLFRYAFRRSRRQLRRQPDALQRAQLAVRIARKTLERPVRNIAIVDYYLKHVTDEAQLRRLDRWLAEEVLHLAFGGHKKGHFRRLPFRRLRQMGLPSLVHRRRLIVHGHLASPFFVWNNQRAQRGCRGTAARPEAPRRSAFSQGPEAAAKASS
jgi:retron-type reverse transcriptase